MFVASVCVGYANTDAEFGTEREAEVWLAEELRRTGAGRGVVYEIEEGIA